MTKLIQHNIYLTSEQIFWLRQHPEFNLSGWVRGELDFEIFQRNKQHKKK